MSVRVEEQREKKGMKRMRVVVMFNGDGNSLLVLMEGGRQRKM